MNKIKVNIDKPEPSDEVIRRHKNFNSFMHNYQKLHTPRGIGEFFRKDMKTLAFIVVVIMLLLIWIFEAVEKEEAEQAAPQTPKVEQTDKYKNSGD